MIVYRIIYQFFPVHLISLRKTNLRMKSANILNPHVELYKKGRTSNSCYLPDNSHTRTTKTRTAWHWSYTLFVVCCLFCGKVKMLQKGNGKPVWVDIYECWVVQVFLKRVILISLTYLPFCVVNVRKIPTWIINWTMVREL